MNCDCELCVCVCVYVYQLYLVHNLRGIEVVQDSCPVETAAIDFHMVAFLEVGRSLVVAADTYAVKVVLDNFLEDFCKFHKKQAISLCCLTVGHRNSK